MTVPESAPGEFDGDSRRLQVGGWTMTERADGDRERLLDPIDRISEVLFGLIMAVTIVGSLSIATADRSEVRTVLVAALGCNLAWGLVDAVMYLVRTLTERSRNRALAARVRATDAAEGRRLIAESLPEHLAAVTGPDELEGMRRRLLALPAANGAALRGKDFLAAIGIFLLVVIATFPVVVPFMLTDDAAIAMREFAHRHARDAVPRRLRARALRVASATAE